MNGAIGEEVLNLDFRCIYVVNGIALNAWTLGDFVAIPV
jgi:hypothetical protein